MKLIQGEDLQRLVHSRVKNYVSANIKHTELDIQIGAKAWVEKERHNTQRVHVLTPNDWNSHMEERRIEKSGMSLLPWRFMLAETMEHFDMPLHIQGILTLRSWAAKSGLEQSSSLTLKAGWSGVLILELFNSLATYELLLTPGLAVAQVQFFDISG